MDHGQQVRKRMVPRGGQGRGWELVIPNPKLKLLKGVLTIDTGEAA